MAVGRSSSGGARKSAARTPAAAVHAFGVGDVVGGKYLVEAVVGEGGMGAVYAAVNQDTGKRVAVKAVLGALASNPQAEARLLREAKTVSRVSHPNVVDVYDVGEQDGVPFLVMELLSGQPLEDLLQRGALSVQDAILLLIPAMRGVAAAHLLGIVHRDLKPDNIFLCTSKEGHLRGVKVLDFGISKTYDEALDSTNLTRSGTILGTPRYMAPEQLANEPIDRRTDVYALGIILYELLTGELPFEGDTFAVMASAKLVGKTVSLRARQPAVPQELEALVMRAIARDPAERFPDVPSFAQALEPFAPGAEFGTAGITLPEITGRQNRVTTTFIEGPSGGARLRALRALLAFAVLALVSLAGAAAWIFLGPDAERAPGAADVGASAPATPRAPGGGEAARGEAAPGEAARGEAVESAREVTDHGGDAPASDDPRASPGPSRDAPPAAGRKTKRTRPGRTGRLSAHEF